MKKILFVCTGNVCRSPVAAAVFNDFAEERGLDHRAESAGVAALEGSALDPLARNALEEVGVSYESHRARQVSREMLEEADLVLVMSPWHVEKLHESFDALPQIRTLPEHVGAVEEHISDPRGGAMVAYRASVRQILAHVSRLTDRLRLP